MQRVGELESKLFEERAVRGRDLEQVQRGQEQLRREQGQQRQELQEEMLQLQEIAQLEAGQAVDKQAVANLVQ